jgi:hypothetical protein
MKKAGEMGSTTMSNDDDNNVFVAQPSVDTTGLNELKKNVDRLRSEMKKFMKDVE